MRETGPRSGDEREVDDRTLIRQYVRERSEAAFALLMRRYLDLVYSICRRELHDSALAEDAAQVVFLHLARKTAALQDRAGSLAGWLCQTARLVCRNLRRQRARRTFYETLAARLAGEPQVSAEQGEEDVWQRVEPHLLTAIGMLRQGEQDLLLLRFFQEHDYAEIGRLRNISPDAARMRVNRALTHLRKQLAKQGIRGTSDDLLERTLLANMRLTPAPAACRETIVLLIHTERVAAVSLSPSALSSFETTHLLYQGVRMAMRLRLLRNAALSGLLGIGLITVGLMGARALHAANMSLQEKDGVPGRPTLAAPMPASQRSSAARSEPAVYVRTRILEKILPDEEDAAGGPGEERVLLAPQLVTRSDAAARIDLDYSDPRQHHNALWTVMVDPHVNADGTLMVRLQWDEKEEDGSQESLTQKRHIMETKRIVRSGQTERISLFKGDRTEIVLEFKASIMGGESDSGKSPSPAGSAQR